MFGFLRRRGTDPAAALREALGSYDLPSFPSVVLNALARLREPDSDPKELAEALSVDPGLTVRVLSVVNSAAFGAGGRIDSVRHAIVLLGRSPLESILLSAGVRDALPACAVGGLDPRGFWRLAAGRAALAGALARELHPRTRALCFTAALLQDMALPLLASRRPEAYEVLLGEAGPGPGLPALEREAFGWDHAEVAAWMAARWDFPEPLAEAIAGHHGQEPAAPPAVELVGLLPRLSAPGALIEAAESRFGLPAARCEELLRTAAAEAEALADRLA